MTRNYNRGKKYIELTAALFASACLFCACGNDKELPTASYSYGPELGLASGNVDLSSDSPDINISDIKSPVGENIDFLSGVTVINEDEYVDLEVWADASTIDIFTPGDYTVTYTFKYSDKSFSKDIKVTIFDPNEGKEPEVSEGASNSLPDENDNDNVDDNGGNDIGNDNGNDSGNDSGNNGETETTGTAIRPNDNTKPAVTDKPETGDKTENTSNSQGSNKPTSTTKPVVTTKPNNTTKPIVTTKPNTTTKPVVTTKPTSTTKPATTTKKDKTTREIITTKSNKTTENKYIGNYTIELLSGKTITVKNSTSKYIVSTRTETSTITKNGSKYKVSKLIIRYNTGAEQILEVVEEKID